MYSHQRNGLSMWWLSHTYMHTHTHTHTYTYIYIYIYIYRCSGKAGKEFDHFLELKNRGRVSISTSSPSHAMPALLFV